MKSIKNILLRFLPESVLIMLKKRHYLRMLQNVTDDQEPDLKMIKCLVHPGDCVLDIGANIGVYTKYLSDLVGENGHVYSFEPVAHTFAVLQSNVKNLNLKNVQVFNCALSDQNGEVTMEVPLYQGGGENYYESRIVSEQNQVSSRQRRVTVMTRTLDAIFTRELASVRGVKFVKCDVEGAELSCLRGAAKILAEQQPIWFIEISSNPDDHQSESYQVFELMRQHGYVAYWFDCQVLKKRVEGDRSINYFFLNTHHENTIHSAEIPATG